MRSGNKLFKEVLSLIMSAFLLIGMIMPANMAFAESGIKDIQGHWAEKQITEWLSSGMAKGYQDNTFKPDNNITRAEFIALVNRSFNISGSSQINFKDVASDKWYYADIAKAVSNGYISGYQDNTIKPENPITRQEVAAILSRLLKLEGDSAVSVDKFKDAKDIPSWSRQPIGAVVAAGYMNGYPDGTFQPVKPITRAEAIVALDNVLKIAKSNVQYTKPGTYGPSTGTEVIQGNATITSPDVTLQNVEIKGDLLLAESIGEGNVYLKNVTVDGETIVKGGGENSIVFDGCNIAKLTISKVNGKIRIVAQGTTKVDNVVLLSGAKLEETGDIEEGFENVVIEAEVPESSVIVLAGNFDEVEISGKGVAVEVASGKINTMTIDESAEGAVLNIAENVTVSEVEVNAKAEVKGNGTIQTAKINADGVKMEQKPQNVEVSKDVTAEVGGKEVSGEPTQGGSGSGGGSSGGSGGNNSNPTNNVPVTGVTLNMETVDLSVGGALKLVANVVPENATNKGLTWTSSNTAVVTVAQDGTVTAVGLGVANITVATQDGNKTDTCIVTVKDVVETPIEAKVSSISDHKANVTFTSEIDCGGNFLIIDSNQAEVMDITSDFIINYDWNRNSYSSWSGDLDLTGDKTDSLEIDHLDHDTSYTLYYVANSQNGSIGKLQSLEFKTKFDTTSPEFDNGPTVISTTGDKVNISVKSSEPASCSYVILKADEAEEFDFSADDVLDFEWEYAEDDGDEQSSNLTEKFFGYQYVSGEEGAHIVVTGLTANEDYKAYFVLEDDAGHVSDVKTIEFTSENGQQNDSTPPSFVTGYPAISTTVNGVEVEFKPNEDSILYFVLKKGTDGNFDAEDIINYNEDESGEVELNENMVLKANDTDYWSYDWLEADTTYTLYCVLLDNALNVSDVDIKQFTTGKETDDTTPGFVQGYPEVQAFEDGSIALVTRTDKDSKIFCQVIESTYAPNYEINTEDIKNLANDYVWYEYYEDDSHVYGYRELYRSYSGDVRLIYLDDLIPGTEYTASLVLKDYSGRTSEVKTVTFVTPEDNTSPDFIEGYPDVEPKDSGATLSVMADEDCKAYYLLILSKGKLSDDEALTADDIVNFDPHKDERFTATQSGSPSVWKNREQRFGFDQLNPGTDYTLYVVLQDSAGNNSELQAIDFTTEGNKILPAFIEGYPIVNYTGDTAEITFKSNVESQLYYLVIEAVYDEAYYDDIITEDFVVNYDEGDLDGLTQDILLGNMHLVTYNENKKDFDLDPDTNYLGYFVLVDLEGNKGGLVKMKLNK